MFCIEGEGLGLVRYKRGGVSPGSVTKGRGKSWFSIKGEGLVLVMYQRGGVSPGYVSKGRG